jgi:hypothetical protein
VATFRLHESPCGQTFPQVPQLLAFSATHEPLHASCPAGHVQAPPMHERLPHECPHAAQLFGSVSSFTHCPLQKL